MRCFAGALPLLPVICWLLPAQSPYSHDNGAAYQGVPAVRKKASPGPAGAAADPKPEPPAAVGSSAEKLTYDVEWRLVHAGDVTIETQRSHAEMKVESAGLVSSLFKVSDTYSADYDEPFCATGSLMDSQEGKRHHDFRVTYDRSQNRATFVERDLLKNLVLHSGQVDIPNCVHDVVGAFLTLRSMHVEPGQSTQIPMSDGRRAASVKVEAQEREEVKTPSGDYKAVRYEANMLNGVVYARRGRAFVWLSDDPRRLPVQIRLRMQFPIGTVTLQLEKEEHP
jgi:hypothetical protein